MGNFSFPFPHLPTPIRFIVPYFFFKASKVLLSFNTKRLQIRTSVFESYVKQSISTNLTPTITGVEFILGDQPNCFYYLQLRVQIRLYSDKNCHAEMCAGCLSVRTAGAVVVSSSIQDVRSVDVKTLTSLIFTSLSRIKAPGIFLNCRKSLVPFLAAISDWKLPHVCLALD